MIIRSKKEKSITETLIQISNISKGLVLHILVFIYIVLPIFIDTSLSNQNILRIMFGAATIWYWFVRIREASEKKKGIIRPRILMVENVVETISIGAMLWFYGGSNGPLFFFYAFTMIESCLLLSTRLPWIIGGIAGTILSAEFIFLIYQKQITPDLINILYFILRFSFLGLLSWHFSALAKANISEKEKSDALGKTTEKLKTAYKNIEELSNMKTEFLKVVNHQLRTPVTIVKGMASMLYEGTVKKGQRKDFIKNLYISSERLTTILNDILMAQRLLGGTEELRFEPCSIEDIVKECISACEVRNEMENLQIVLKKPKSDLPITLADKENIERSIRRLIDNAILYTDKGKINISLSLKREADKKFIKISIKDSGIGFSKKDAQNLFKLFYRGDQATRMHTNGSGLGLFIVKNLIEAHKGRVEATSNGEGKGAKFVISLPVVTEV